MTMPKKITVLYLGQTGGGPLDTLGILKGLAYTKKWDITSITSKNNNQNHAYSEFSKIHKIKTHRPNVISLAFHTLLFYRILLIVRKIRLSKPDILLVTMIHPWMPIVFLFSGLLKKKYSTAIIIHNQQEMQSFSGNTRNTILRTLESVLIKKFDILLTFSKMVKNQLMQKNIPGQKQELHSITFGAHTYICPGFQHNGFAKNRKIKFLFFGRILDYKGLDLLTEAWIKISMEFKNVSLMVAGSGKIQDEILVKLNHAKANVQNTYITDKELCQILAHTDVIIIPYRQASQSGPANIAIACSIPAIATNVGALPEQIKHNHNGIIVEPDSESIYKAIKFFAQNPDKLASYHKNAMHWRDNVINWNQTGKQLDSIFNNKIV